MVIDTEKLTISEARKHLDAGDFSAVELAEAHLKHTEERDGGINAYLEVFDDVLDQAREADRKIQDTRHKIQGLTGIPLAIKDNILIKGRVTSAASKILENYTATYDATVIAKLKEAGAVFLGRTNMDEFAMGSSTEQSAFQKTKNPHDMSRVPGGSSGGSAAGVAAGMALGALGSDTAGSIRQPASFCGVVGLKPTYGAVSRYGLVALGSSLDCVGPIAKTVEDAELLFEAIRGKDKRDSTTVDARDYSNTKKERKTVGVFDFNKRGFFESAVIQGVLTGRNFVEVHTNYLQSIGKLEKLGYQVEMIDLPNVKHAVPTYYILLPAEASANLARFDGMKYGLHQDGENLLGDYLKTRHEGFGPEPRRRIILGTYVLSAGYHDAYYSKALAVRQLIKRDFEEAFKKVDVIALPTTPGPAFKIGEKTRDPVEMYLEDIFTVLANHAGLPAISIPSGTVEEEGKQLPLGIQLMAPHMHEHLLFEVGKRFEEIQSRTK